MASSSSRCKINVQAVRIGGIFKTYCSAPETSGTVHSVFSHAVNLRMEDGGLITAGSLLTVVTADRGGSSRFLTVNAGSLSRFPLEQGQKVKLSQSEAEIGPLRIGLEGARPFRGVIGGDARGTVSRYTVSRFKAVLDRLEPGAGIHTGPEPGLLEMMSDRSRAAEAVRGLIGLGPGLTPAGDDMTLGFLAVQNHLGKDEILREILCEAVLANLARTTDIGAQMLYDAAHRDYHESVQAVVAALCDNAAESLGILLPRLFAIGASSGSDIAAGMAAALAGLAE